VAPRTIDLDAPVSCGNHPKDFRGHPSEGSPISSSVSSERPSRVCRRFLLQHEPVILIPVNDQLDALFSMYLCYASICFEWSRDSSVGIATRYGPEGPGIESRWGEIFRTYPDRLRGPPSLLYNGYRVFPCGKGGRSVMLTTRPLLVPRLRKLSYTSTHPMGPPGSVTGFPLPFTCFEQQVLIIRRIKLCQYIVWYNAL
jgi:hypothetical protein